LGGNVHVRRLRQGMTLQELADRTGVSRAMISEIERGTKNPTVRVALQLASGLDCTVSELLQERAPRERRAQVLRRDRERVLVHPGSGVERHLLSTAFDRRGITIARYVVPGRRKTALPPSRPAGAWAHLTLLQGNLDCHLDGADSDVHLEAGDALEFRADSAYTFENPGRRSCELLLIVDAGARPALAYMS
jgi:transcriptional regulator with XRE-family HTH domain